MEEVVSVLMSVHNEKSDFLKLAIKSICDQTYPSIEFIIIDDASDKECSLYLKKLCNEYNHIKLIRNEYNLGLTKTLNKGLSIARGTYIARMDADDYSCPDRIEKQVSFLQRHDNIDVLGTGVVSFGKKSVFMSPMNGLSYKRVEADLFFTSTLCHPSVMIRRSFLQRTGLLYDELVKKGQDYDLWERASVSGHLAVMSNVLLYYRLHDTQITSKSTKEQQSTAEMVMKRRLNRIGINPTEEEFRCHLALKGYNNEGVSMTEIELWSKKILSANEQTQFVDKSIFKWNIQSRLTLCYLKQKNIKSLLEPRIYISLIYNRIIIFLLLFKHRRIINILQLKNEN